VVTEEMSFHFSRCGSRTLHITKCGQEPGGCGYVWYGLPAVLAYARGHPHRHGILVWTLALGWTGTGWLAALWYTLWTWEARPRACRTSAGLLVLVLALASPTLAGVRPLHHVRGEGPGPPPDPVRRRHAGSQHLEPDPGALGEHRHPAAGAGLPGTTPPEDLPVGGALSMSPKEEALTWPHT